MFLMGRTVLNNITIKITTSLMYMSETSKEHFTGIMKQQLASCGLIQSTAQPVLGAQN